MFTTFYGEFTVIWFFYGGKPPNPRPRCARRCLFYYVQSTREFTEGIRDEIRRGDVKRRLLSISHLPPPTSFHIQAPSHPPVVPAFPEKKHRYESMKKVERCALWLRPTHPGSTSPASSLDEPIESVHVCSSAFLRWGSLALNFRSSRWPESSSGKVRREGEKAKSAQTSRARKPAVTECSTPPFVHISERKRTKTKAKGSRRIPSRGSIPGSRGSGASSSLFVVMAGAGLRREPSWLRARGGRDMNARCR